MPMTSRMAETMMANRSVSVSAWMIICLKVRGNRIAQVPQCLPRKERNPEKLLRLARVSKPTARRHPVEARDRNRLATPSIGRSPSSRETQPATARLAQPCLLYTSDAADEED